MIVHLFYNLPLCQLATDRGYSKKHKVKMTQKVTSPMITFWGMQMTFNALVGFKIAPFQRVCIESIAFYAWAWGTNKIDMWLRIWVHLGIRCSTRKSSVLRIINHNYIAIRTTKLKKEKKENKQSRTCKTYRGSSYCETAFSPTAAIVQYDEKMVYKRKYQSYPL